MRKAAMRWFLWIAAVTLIIPQAARAQFQYVGIRSENFEASYSTQRSEQWCWAASIQMILNYYGLDVTQEDIVQRSFGSLANEPGSMEVITANLNNWSVDREGNRYVVTAILGPGAPSPAILLNELFSQHPVLVGYISGPNSGHAVVVTAASYSPGPVVQTVIVRDPWPTNGPDPSHGRREYPGLAIAQRMTSYWLIRVQTLLASTVTSATPSPNALTQASNASELKEHQPAAAAFASQLATVVDAAPDRFKSLEGKTELEGSQDCGLRSDNRPQVSCTYRARSTDDYDRLKHKVKTALGDDWRFSEDTSGTAVQTTTMKATKPGAKATVTVAISTFPDGQNRLHLLVGPAQD